MKKDNIQNQKHKKNELANQKQDKPLKILIWK